MRNLGLLLSLILVYCLAGCEVEQKPESKKPVIVAKDKVYSFAWESKSYTNQLVNSIKESALMTAKPKDLKDFGYTGQDPIEFWGNIMVKMSYYESRWKTDTKYQESFNDRSGERIYSRGLFQLSLESSKGYPKCQMKTKEDFHIAEKNINCAVAIMEKWVVRDGVIRAKVKPPVNASKWDKGWRGGARYWSVIRGTHSSHTKNALSAIMRANM